MKFSGKVSNQLTTD